MKIITCATLSASLLSWALAYANPREPRELPENLQKASDLIGLKVENTSGENLGKIEDIVLDTSNGRISYAVLSFGGFLGIGDKFFAIPWQAVKENRAKKTCVLALDKESLKNAPGFDKKSWPDMADAKWRAQIHEFYKVPLEERGGGVELGLSEIRREAVQLPLNLRQGTVITYSVLCDKDKEVRFQVLNASGDESLVQVSCDEQGAGKEPMTARVAKDGTVRFEEKTKTESAAAREPAGGASRDLTPGSNEAENREKAQILVQHIFGQGLHRERLEPGKDYTMPGSLHGFSSGYRPGTSTSEGAAQRETSTAPSAPATTAAAGSAAHGSHAMRYEGIAKRDGNAVAVFSFGAPATEPRIRPTEPRSESRPGSESGLAAASGKAVYRTDDGWLDALVLEGLSVRRVESKSNLGN